MTPAKSTKTKINFEKSLADLEAIVHRLEEEEVPLEVSLKLFEEGQRLARECERQLSAAENQVRKLIETPAGVEEAALDNEEADEPCEDEARSDAAGATDDSDEDEDDEPLGGEADRGRLPF